MGYEIKMMVGKSSVLGAEHVRDEKNPFDDGSGFPYLKDEKGEYVMTGRTEIWFQIMAEVDLCKLGYADDALNRLISKSHKDANDEKLFVWSVYGLDGNTAFKEDRYGDRMRSVPIREVLAAMEEHSDEYRRIKWAKTLLRSMADDSEELEVLFWGY